MRRAVGGEPQSQVYQDKKAQLGKLEQLDENGESVVATGR
jgi:hypothetical protein